MQKEESCEIVIPDEFIDLYNVVLNMSTTTYDKVVINAIYKGFSQLFSKLKRYTKKEMNYINTSMNMSKILNYIFPNNWNYDLMQEHIIELDKIKSEFKYQKEIFILMNKYVLYLKRNDKSEDLLDLYVHFIILYDLYMSLDNKLDLIEKSFDTATSGIQCFLPEVNEDEAKKKTIKMYSKYIGNELRI